MPSQLVRKVMPYTAAAADWTLGNDYLDANEIGIETDTGKMKQGPGNWTDLAYIGEGLEGIAYFTAEDEAARLALTPQIGDECEQLDEGTVYKYIQTSDFDHGSGAGAESGSGAEDGMTAGWVVLYPQ